MTELQHKESELVDVEKLVPYHNNPKEHPEEQIDKIASSIKNYGFIQPIVTDKDNEVIIGHGRLQAAKKLDLEKVPVIKKDDLTESEAKALRLADNRIAETDWEQEKLAVELEQLTEAEDYEELITGFDEDEMSEYLDSLTDEEDLEEPDTPEVEQIETDIEEGDVYQLGDNRLMCGDATNEEHVETLMDGNKADMVFTDPPYGVEYSGGKKEREELENDKSGDLKKLLQESLQRIKEVKKDSTAIYLWFAGNRSKTTYNAVFEAGFEPSAQLIWAKNIMAGGWSDYRYRHEPCIYIRGEWHGGRTENTVWEVDRETELKHPTQKPVELPSRAIQNSSKKNDIILDLFGGSGSTLLAAEQTDRTCFMMELEPKYCQVIINRWEELTDKESEKLN